MEATTCALCKGFLLNKSRKGRAHSLTAIKDKGGLTFASDVLDYVIRYSEQRLINLLDDISLPNRCRKCQLLSQSGFPMN